MTHTVVYYIGGTQAGEWRRCLPVATIEAANTMAAEIERGGRVAYVRPTREWDILGLPEGPPRREPSCWTPQAQAKKTFAR